MLNPYIEATQEAISGAYPPEQGERAIALALLAIAWELQQQREKREAEAQREYIRTRTPLE